MGAIDDFWAAGEKDTLPSHEDIHVRFQLYFFIIGKKRFSNTLASASHLILHGE